MYYSSNHSTYPLPYHLSIPAEIQPTPSNVFVSPNLRDDLQQRTVASLETRKENNLSEYVHVYHSLVPIDTNKPNSKAFGYPTWTYRAISNRDGRVYCLRRIEGYRLTNEKSISVVQVWNTIKTACVVALLEAFTTRAFGDSSLIFVYDYYPMSKTLTDIHFLQDVGVSVAIPEKVVWSYVNQIVSALQKVHGNGLAARTLDASRILQTGKGRIRLNCTGIFDVLQYEHAQTISTLQQEDIQKLGKLILELGTSSVVFAQKQDEAKAFIEQSYSKSLTDLLHYILSPGDKSVSEIIAMTSERILESFNDAQSYTSYVERQLSSELENGRFVRLLSKIGIVTDRPELDKTNAMLSEFGEQHPIKLFRDYLFHHNSQEENSSKSRLDMSHILKTLNKLDAGIDENILLMSRDDVTVIIMSYKEVRRAFALTVTLFCEYFWANNLDQNVH